MAERLDLNSGKSWSEMDLFDLRVCLVENKDSLEDTSRFLCRSIEEVEEKAREMGIAVRHDQT